MTNFRYSQRSNDRRRSASPRWCWRIFVLAIGWFTSSGCDLDSSTDGTDFRNSVLPAKPPVVRVIAAVAQDRITEITTSYGTLKPARSIDLAFGRGGRITLLAKQEGELVLSGEQIASLDVGDLPSQRNELQEAIEQANANLAAESQSPIASLTRQRDAIDQQIAAATIVAPWDGVVASVRRDVGQNVSQGMPVIELHSREKPIAEMRLATGIAREMEVGREVTVILGNRDATDTPDEVRAVKARVSRVLPTVDGASRSRQVMLEIQDDLVAARYVPGDVVEIRFGVERESSGFWLPRSAIAKQASGLWSTMVLETDGKRVRAMPRTVEIVRHDEPMVFVRGSLQDGDRVIADGLHRIVPGQEVEVQPPVEEGVVPGGGASRVGAPADSPEITLGRAIPLRTKPEPIFVVDLAERSFCLADRLGFFREIHYSGSVACRTETRSVVGLRDIRLCRNQFTRNRPA